LVVHQQIEVQDIIDQLWDAVIIGGGPAGAICALTLARKGVRVLVVDKHRFPRQKACGDLLIPDSLTILKRLSLLDQVAQAAHSVGDIRVFSPSRVDFKVQGDYLAIKRFNLDLILMQAAIDEGATFARGDVCSIEPSPNQPATLRLADSLVLLRGRVVITATGADIGLPQKLGMVAQSAASAVAIRKYVRSSVEIEDIILSYDRNLVPGYAWIVPLGKGEYNVGCGVRMRDGNHKPPNLKRMLTEFLGSFPLARELERLTTETSKIEGAALRCGLVGCSRIVRDNLVLIGEVIGTTFPFTGEGIGKAMHTGELAAMAVLDALKTGDMSKLQSYPEAVAREIAPHYDGYLQAERWLSRPWLSDFFARRVRKSPYLKGELERFMAETGDPRSAFGPSGLLKSFWK